MRVKRIAAAALIIALTMALSVCSFAASPAIVYGNGVNTNPNSIFFVPVYIKNNPGIMGFKISVKYDEAVLYSPVVTRGKVTESGMLNDSIGVSEAGVIDIVWSGDSGVQNDDTLFIISFNVDETQVKNTSLSLSFSQADTFNEAYEDVTLTCRDIQITFGEAQTDAAYQGEVREPGYQDVIVAVEAELKEFSFGSINSIDADFNSEFLAKVNESLFILTGSQDYFKSVDEVKGAYRAAVANDFIASSCEAVDPGTITGIVDAALKEVNAESIDKIPEDKKDEFIASVEAGISSYAKDVGKISEVLSGDEAMEAIKALKSANESNIAAGKKVELSKEPGGNSMSTTVTVCVLLVVALFLILALMLRQQSRKIKKTDKPDESDEPDENDEPDESDKPDDTDETNEEDNK